MTSLEEIKKNVWSLCRGN